MDEKDKLIDRVNSLASRLAALEIERAAARDEVVIRDATFRERLYLGDSKRHLIIQSKFQTSELV